MSVDPVSINGNEFDWGSILVTLNGDPINGVAALKYSDKLERQKSYGLGKAHKPRGRTRGKYAAEGSITFWVSTAESFRQRLNKLSNGKGFGSVTFQLVVQYVEDGQTTITIELVDCRVAGDDGSAEENPDPLKEEFPLDIMSLRRNGITLYDSTGEGIGAAALAALSGIVGGI
jgi:hypothetical protein